MCDNRVVVVNHWNLDPKCWDKKAQIFQTSDSLYGSSFVDLRDNEPPSNIDIYQ